MSLAVSLLKEEEIEIRRAQHNASAFGVLYERYFKKIYLFVLNRVREKEAAVDITQDTFVKALSGINTYQNRGLPFSSWLFRIAINETNSFFRKKNRARIVPVEESQLKNLREELGEDETEVTGFAKKLPYLFEQLSEKQVSLIELRFFEDKSFKDIGEILNMTEINAKIQTYRTIDKMKKIYVDERE